VLPKLFDAAAPLQLISITHGPPATHIDYPWPPYNSYRLTTAPQIFFFLELG
jgi:hypothetical protein